MKDETISSLRKFALEMRAFLEKEINEQLEGLYGFLPNGSLESQAKYPALNELEEAKETRKRLEQYIIDEQSIGICSKDARERLIRETAFTWLNRFVAFKMMETRKLLKETITRGSDSNGFKLWLTEPGNESTYQKYEAGDFPQNHIGEGPRQEAYRLFLLSRCKSLAEEIHVLFDPNNLQSQLCPRPRVLSNIFEYMNKADLKEAWEPGNNETIGWVYQFFNSEELENAFREARESGKKFEAKDIPSVTQLFTPRWIVKFIVHNSLGRFWLDMHPDSDIGDNLDYFIPLKGDRPDTEIKPVSEIKFLDPACGSMHFGLIAFDIFMLMYQEELDKAGNDGWLEKSSCSSPELFPSMIIAKNIYGIDIDLRAVQLSALSLYIKARSINALTRISESNLACADIHLLGGEEMDFFINETGLNRPIYRRVLEALQSVLKDSEQLGSLLRLEDTISSLIQKEKERFEREGRQPSFPGWSENQFESAAGKQEFWDLLEEQIEQALNNFASTNSGQEEHKFFVGEAKKGLRYLDLVSRKYDVVATNPPYLSAGKMNKRLKDLVGNQYPNGKQDLFATFLIRCNELVRSNGLVGILTMHSYMFNSSYEHLRSLLREQIAIQTMCHTGPALFSVGNPGTLQTTAVVFRYEENQDIRENSIGTYFRLVKEPDGESKRQRFEEALKKLKNKKEDSIVYYYIQSYFDAIPQNPWVYWVTPNIRGWFSNLNRIDQFAKPWVGLQTSNNNRFIRFWWEIGIERIFFDCPDSDHALRSTKKWFPHAKGGTSRKWYGSHKFIVNWGEDGKVMKAFGEELKGKVKSPPGNGPLRDYPYYFMPGITWSHTSSKGLNVRLLPRGFICNVESMAAYPSTKKILTLTMAVLNSDIASLVTNQLNPTIHYGQREIAHIPVFNFTAADETELDSIVKELIELARVYSSEDECSYDFVIPTNWANARDNLVSRTQRIKFLEQELNERIFNLYKITEEDKKVIQDELMLENPSEQDDNNEENKFDIVLLSNRWISYAFGIVIGRFKFNNSGPTSYSSFSEEVNKKLAMLSDPDGIMVIDEGHSDDITQKIIKCLTVIFRTDETANIIRNVTGKIGDNEELLRDYISTKFFKDHIQLYRKRPVYWLLQSPQKKYGVWVFHERFTKDTLFRIQSEYVEPKIKLLESQIDEFRAKRDSSEGRERREAEKELSRLTEILDDVREFSKKIKKITDRGYTHHIDDGVLINMAPLWELIPSWQSELKKAWQSLEKGEWDWSYQAMDHWPDRVKEKCRKNKSYAIAHGLEDLYEGNN